MVELKSGATDDHRSLLLPLRTGAKTVLASALVLSLVAVGLLSMSLPRTVLVPSATITPNERYAFFVPTNVVQDLLIPPVLSGLYAPYSDGTDQNDRSELLIAEDGQKTGSGTSDACQDSVGRPRRVQQLGRCAVSVDFGQ